MLDDRSCTLRFDLRASRFRVPVWDLAAFAKALLGA